MPKEYSKKVKKIVQDAHDLAEQKRAEGWTRADAAAGLAEMLGVKVKYIYFTAWSGSENPGNMKTGNGQIIMPRRVERIEDIREMEKFICNYMKLEWAHITFYNLLRTEEIPDATAGNEKP